MMEKISDVNGEDRAVYCAYCGYCGSEIAWKGTGKQTGKKPGKRTWNKRINVHINICQEPSILYFCNQKCKLNWIFRSPDVERDNDIKTNRAKNGVKITFDLAESEENAEELKKYLKNHNIRILRQA